MVCNEIKKDNRPWVEKYRPVKFSNIVLDDMTKEILTKIIENKNMPNLLLYGPPGTGKTTTIINLVNEYREMIGEKGPGMIIHLNASDERGVDIVRGPLSNFANSNNMFIKGTKFVILDEADYMTIPAQISLRQLIQKNHNIRFCLICNYVSKVETSLRNEFVRIRFNHLPDELITKFLLEISEKENLGLTVTDIDDIRQMFGSDIRSMINFIQTSYIDINTIKHSSKSNIHKDKTDKNQKSFLPIIKNTEWEQLFDLCIKYKELIESSVCVGDDVKKNTINISNCSNKIIQNLISFSNRGFGIRNVIREFISFIIIMKPEYITKELLNKTEFVIHNDSNELKLIADYFLKECITYIKIK